MFMWIGHSVDPNWVQNVFSVQSAAQIDIDKVGNVCSVMMYFILDSSFIEIGNGSESCLLLNLILSKLNSDINWALH